MILASLERILAKGRTGEAPALDALEENKIRKLGDWAELVSSRISRAELERGVLAETELIERLIDFHAAALADPRAAGFAHGWSSLQSLHG
jgi:hypothetical protein